jgi:hypothetical protein
MKNKSNIEAIDLNNLTSVTGGGTSTGKQQIGVQATLPKLGPVNVGGTNESATTDYKTCTDAVRKFKGSKPADLIATCGLPPSN